MTKYFKITFNQTSAYSLWAYFCATNGMSIFMFNKRVKNAIDHQNEKGSRLRNGGAWEITFPRFSTRH